MLIIRSSQPPSPKYEPPPRYRPKKPFWDMRASHWVQIILTVALIGVGVSQLWVYRRQAGIMDTQARISEQANNLTQSIQRAFVTVSEVRRERIDDQTGT